MLKIVAFLPTKLTSAIQTFFAPSELVLARNWIEVDTSLQRLDTKLLVFDPSAEGELNLRAVVRVLRRHRAVPSIAYVEPLPANLKVVWQLSRYGLTDALAFEPDQECELYERILLHLGRETALQILGAIEPGLSRCPSSLSAVLQDLFENPQKYQTLDDIRRASGLSGKKVVTALHRARLGSPKKLIAISKVVWGYAFIAHSRWNAESISTRLGYSRRGQFAENVRAILGAPPSNFREHSALEEIAMDVMECLCRPHGASCEASVSIAGKC